MTSNSGEKSKSPPPSDFAIIRTTNGYSIIVDREDYTWLNRYSWTCKKSHSRYYAMRKPERGDTTYWVRMHRQIMHTPKGQVVHHKNKRPLDNRKSNLENMLQKHHQKLHEIKFPGALRIAKKKDQLNT